MVSALDDLRQRLAVLDPEERVRLVRDNGGDWFAVLGAAAPAREARATASPLLGPPPVCSG